MQGEACSLAGRHLAGLPGLWHSATAGGRAHLRAPPSPPCAFYAAAPPARPAVCRTRQRRSSPGACLSAGPHSPTQQGRWAPRVAAQLWASPPASLFSPAAVASAAAAALVVRQFAALQAPLLLQLPLLHRQRPRWSRAAAWAAGLGRPCVPAATVAGGNSLHAMKGVAEGKVASCEVAAAAEAGRAREATVRRRCCRRDDQETCNTFGCPLAV